MTFKKGEQVLVEVYIGGITTTEKKKVIKVDTKGIWLDNGEGNRPSGPFDKKNLDLISLRGLGIGSQTLKKIK